MRVFAYVDGFNLYYRALKNTPYKWVNLAKLAATQLSSGDQVTKVRYFTARVSSRAGDPDAPRRQQILFNALKTIPEIEFHYGRFLAKTKKRPLVANPNKYVEVHDTEEKGSDVNLASHLLFDAFKNNYDAALVMSQDTDLIGPIRMVAKEIKKPVGLVWLDGGRPDARMKAAASFVRHISNANLAAAQFPNPLKLADGTELFKPTTW
jgi:uncharacterized LabA/DUF88 family protein